MRAGVLQLHRWGVLDAVLAAGTPPIRRTIFRYGDDETVVTLKSIAGVDALYAPRRTVLDAALADAAAAAGADVRFGHTVTGVRRAADGTVAGVTGRDRDGAPFAIDAPLTVGADGVGSRIARWVSAPLERLATSASALVYAHVPGLESPGYELFYNPGVTAGVIPTNGGEACVYVGVPPDRFRAELSTDIRAAFGQVLTEAAPDLHERVAAAGEPHGFRSFPGLPGYFRRPFGPGWALVGDAGYFKDPLTAHGMTDALRDAELLARADVRASGPRSLPGHLDAYHRSRNRLSTALFVATEAIASFTWDTTTIGPLLRAVSAGMSDEVNEVLALDLADAGARQAG
jgi:2-polyprenyl-6-methoxyphenol hydroxylase-like FAD-dependent oxidoreductase